MTGVVGHGHAHQVRQKNPIIRKISFYWKADDMVPDPGKSHKTKIGWRRLLSTTSLVKNGLACDRFPLNLLPAAIRVGRGTMLHRESIVLQQDNCNCHA